MTNPQQHSQKPSQKLLASLRQMSDERGVTFVYPATMAEGRVQFQELKKIPRIGRRDRRREDRAVRDAMSKRGGGAAIRDSELGGYGSTASWAGP